MRDTVGVIHGRFQMLHNGHMEYLLEGKKRCDYLIIGICNPDITLTKYSSVNPHRSERISNPLTYYERFQIINGAMLEAGVRREEFDVVPFPINYPELLFNYVPKEAKFYLTIYDQWGLDKKAVLEKLGCSVDVMWERNIEDRVTSGTQIRQYIREGKTWNRLVPEFTYKYVIEHGIDKRICNMR